MWPILKTHRHLLLYLRLGRRLHPQTQRNEHNRQRMLPMERIATHRKRWTRTSLRRHYISLRKSEGRESERLGRARSAKGSGYMGTGELVTERRCWVLQERMLRRRNTDSFRTAQGRTFMPASIFFMRMDLPRHLQDCIRSKFQASCTSRRVSPVERIAYGLRV